MLQRKVGMCRTEASYEMTFERLDSSFRRISSVVSGRCQLIVNVMSLHLCAHERRDFVIKALKFGL